MSPEEKALTIAREAKTLIYDTETSGVDWRRSMPVGHALYDLERGEGVYVPVRHGGGANIAGGQPLSAPDARPAAHPFEDSLSTALAARSGPIVGHNIKFDCHQALNVGIRLGRNIVCTQNTQALIYNLTPNFSLEWLAGQYKVQAKQSEAMYEHLWRTLQLKRKDKETMADFWRLPGNDPVAVSYAVGDCETTGQLHLRQRDRIAAQGMNDLWDMENRLTWTLVKMERRGIAVALDAIGDVETQAQAAINAIASEFPPDFNPNSRLEMQAWLTELGRTDWPLTARGEPSFPAGWLETFDEGRRITEYRKALKLRSGFIGPFVDTHVWNGRVHCGFNQNRADNFGTITGRLSCSNPNLQQVPKHDRTRGRLFRRLFKADEGQTLFEMDWSQCEPRLYAHYTQDPYLIKGYTQTPERDVHTIVAEMLERDRNSVAKRLNLGMFYGMGESTLAGHMGCSAQEAGFLHTGWHKLFQGVRPFLKKAEAVMRERGYVRTVLGRRAYMQDARRAYKAGNAIIQGGAADLMKTKLVELDRMTEERGDMELLLTVHDSIAGQVEDVRVLEDYRRAFNDVQGPPFHLRVPFRADLATGKDWAECSYG